MSMQWGVASLSSHEIKIDLHFDLHCAAEGMNYCRSCSFKLKGCCFVGVYSPHTKMGRNRSFRRIIIVCGGALVL